MKMGGYVEKTLIQGKVGSVQPYILRIRSKLLGFIALLLDSIRKVII